jgi:hypothetical protein
VSTFRDGATKHRVRVRGPEDIQRAHRRWPSVSRSMSVRKVRRWSSRAEACMENGMKNVG